MSAHGKIRILIGIAAAVLLFVVIFHTEEITVTGAVHVTAEEVIAGLEESPVSSNTVLLLLWNKIKPYGNRNFVKSVTLSLDSPGRIRARVTEKSLAGYIYADGRYWYFNRNGVLAAVSDTPEEPIKEQNGYVSTDPYLPYLAGISVRAAAEGDSLPGANSGFYERFATLTVRLNENRLIPDELYADESMRLSLVYGKITVALGDLTNLDLKVNRMEEILPMAEELGEGGTLHLENYDGTGSGIVFEKD